MSGKKLGILTVRTGQYFKLTYFNERYIKFVQNTFFSHH